MTGEPCPASNRVAVVDVGSNSLRLVVFDRLDRAPVPVFNEGVMCGLGQGLSRTGTLNPDGIQLALRNLRRFAQLADAMGVARLDVLATAAVREADNGPDFVDRMEAAAGVGVRVLSGAGEARLAGLGVIAGAPGADGIVGDLGGGSLELVRVRNDEIAGHASLPLGPLRLADAVGSDRKALKAEIERQLDRVPWLGDGAPAFYPVGGAWRTLARVHMEQSGYPLHVIHGYALAASEARETARVVSRLSPDSLKKMRAVAKKRRATLPCAAQVFQCVAKRTGADRVRFSAFGLREGHLYELLDPAERGRDPLLVAASTIAAEEGRFGDLGPALEHWTAPLFPDETAHERRLRRAACHLADVAWREHPDYRAEQALKRILQLPLFAVTHGERAFLALTAFVRYGGKPGAADTGTARQLLDARGLERGEVLGLALRLAITICGGTAALLQCTALDLTADHLGIALPGDGTVIGGDALERRLKRLAKATGRSPGPVG